MKIQECSQGGNCQDGKKNHKRSKDKCQKSHFQCKPKSRWTATGDGCTSRATTLTATTETFGTMNSVPTQELVLRTASWVRK